MKLEDIKTVEGIKRGLENCSDHLGHIGAMTTNGHMENIHQTTLWYMFSHLTNEERQSILAIMESMFLAKKKILEKNLEAL